MNIFFEGDIWWVEKRCNLNLWHVIHVFWWCELTFCKKWVELCLFLGFVWIIWSLFEITCCLIITNTRMSILSLKRPPIRLRQIELLAVSITSFSILARNNSWGVKKILLTFWRRFLYQTFNIFLVSGVLFALFLYKLLKLFQRMNLFDHFSFNFVVVSIVINK